MFASMIVATCVLFNNVPSAPRATIWLELRRLPLPLQPLLLGNHRVYPLYKGACAPHTFSEVREFIKDARPKTNTTFL